MLTILAVGVVFCVLLLAEYLSRYKGVHSELTRKFVHILVGVFVAFWPFFLSWGTIKLLSAAFLIVIGLSIKFNIFQSIHAVKRNVNGEIFFALVIGLLAFIVTNKWMFAAAMLNLSIADGLAAIIGLGWGENNGYKVLGHAKSLAGSLTFFFCSMAIMLLYVGFSPASADAFTLLWLPLLATAAENLAVNGTDNLVIPLLVGLALTSSL
jgi:phytol kinase